MTEDLTNQRKEMAEIIERHTKQDGPYSTDIPSLSFARFTDKAGPYYGVYKPSLCIIVQGEKQVFLSRESFIYGPSDYLIASVDLPVTGQVIEASTDAPYLAVTLQFSPSDILEVLREFQLDTDKKERSKRGMYVSKIDASLMDAVTRLIRLLETPEDINVLAPLIMKEIIYRVLQGENGNILKQLAVEGSSTRQIYDVIEHIINNYHRSYKIEELADIAAMSVSSLHRHFKEVTAMSPIQFQKQLRLQEARSLLLSRSDNAAEVAFHVGYESPSQFNREYSRLFGLPPVKDIKRLKAYSN